MGIRLVVMCFLLEVPCAVAVAVRCEQKIHQLETALKPAESMQLPC